MDAKAEATIKVDPRGNQIAVALLLSFSAIFFAVACYLYVGASPFILPLIGSIVFLLLGVVFWLVAYRSESLKNVKLLEFDLDNGGQKLKLSADPRSIPSFAWLEQFVTSSYATFNRAPLPQASGMIDEQGCPIDDSFDKASQVIREANIKGRSETEKHFGAFLAGEMLQAVSSDTPVIAKVPDGDGGSPKKI